MNDLEIAALIVIVAWLGVLSLVLVLAIRQITLLTARIDRSGVVYRMEDGPAIGSQVPDGVVEALPGVLTGVTHLLLISATCTPCRQLAEELRDKTLPKNGTTTALVPGRTELANGIVNLLPSDTEIVRDPDATEIAHALQLQRVPAALTLERGIVVAKSPPITSASELLRFLEHSAEGSIGKSLARE